MGKAGPQETPRGNTRARARRASVGENEKNKNAMTTKSESQNNEKSVRVNALYVHCTQTHNQINTIRLKEDSCDFMK